jgi:hypothetical protein
LTEISEFNGECQTSGKNSSIDRKEAISFLKEISGASRGFSPQIIQFEDKTLEGKGVTIHIKGVHNSEDMKTIKTVAAEYKLLVVEQDGEYIIYRPQKLELNL